MKHLLRSASRTLDGLDPIGITSEVDQISRKTHRTNAK